MITVLQWCSCGGRPSWSTDLGYARIYCRQCGRQVIELTGEAYAPKDEAACKWNDSVMVVERTEK